MAEPEVFTRKIKFEQVHFGLATLTLNLVMLTRGGPVIGHGDISRSFEPAHPPAHIPQLKGHLQPAGRDDLRLLSVTGTYIESAAPPATGTVSGPFHASCTIDADWNGQGAFYWGSWDVDDCLVSNIGT
jgi:hypothetical protein